MSTENGVYTVYAAGGMFNQHELAANVLIKEAVWRLSGGRFELVLPQSKEQRQLDLENTAAQIRNLDLLQVLMADLLVARFDGQELDSGTVVEFMMAKQLGKPAVILRSDYRGLSGAGREDPYNLMVKNWPRTVEVHVESLMRYIERYSEEAKALGHNAHAETKMQTELTVMQAGIDELAEQLVDGLKAAKGSPSPYPPEYREMVYRAARYSPGCGFNDMLPDRDLDVVIQRLHDNGTL